MTYFKWFGHMLAKGMFANVENRKYIWPKCELYCRDIPCVHLLATTIVKSYLYHRPYPRTNIFQDNYFLLQSKLSSTFIRFIVGSYILRGYFSHAVFFQDISQTDFVIFRTFPGLKFYFAGWMGTPSMDSLCCIPKTLKSLGGREIGVNMTTLY